MRCYAVFNKIFVTLLKSASAVAYVLLMGILFAFPISFFVHVFIPPEFELNSAVVVEVEENDSYLKEAEETTEGWKRIDYRITASSGFCSPYDYVIEELTVKNEDALPAGAEYKVFLDEPSVFDKDNHDKMVVSLYIKTDEEIKASEYMNIEFKCKVYEKNFEEFKVKYGNGKLWK